MNKLRLIKIYELQGKVHPIEEYLIGILDGIVEVKFGKYIKYKKDGILIFVYFTYTNDVRLFENILYDFKSSIEETREIMKYLLEKHLKLKIIEVL